MYTATLQAVDNENLTYTFKFVGKEDFVQKEELGLAILECVWEEIHGEDSWNYNVGIVIFDPNGLSVNPTEFYN